MLRIEVRVFGQEKERAVAHLRGRTKGENAPGGKFLGVAKYSNFYY
jgi:hypothetical protein